MSSETDLNFSDEKRQYFGGKDKAVKVQEALSQFGAEYNDQSPEISHDRLIILQVLQRAGALSTKEGPLIVDSSKLYDIPTGRERTSKSYTGLEIAQALSGLEAIDRQENGSQAAEAKTITEFPESIDDLLSNGASGYSARSQRAILQPWEIRKQVKTWVVPIKLPSRETTNLGEMAITNFLEQNQALREQDGTLTIVNPKTSQRVKFSPSLVKEWSGLGPTAVDHVGEQKRTVSFDKNPYEFLQKYLPSLAQRGVLKKEDFRIMGGRATAEIYNVHEKRLNPKAPYLTYTNAAGQTAKYYIGREKIVGTGIAIKPEAMKALQLDPETVAIVQDDNGKKEIIRIFPLLTGGPMEELKDSVKRRLLERGLAANGKNIATNTTVGEKWMVQSMREYSVTEFLQPRPGEDQKEYYKRLRPLDNPDFVLEKVQKFFSQAGIGTHNLPWSEQLVLSRALLEGVDEKRLLQFSKNYGLVGVRSFLSLDYDRKLGGKILNLGEKLEPKLAQEVFKKYGEIVDAATQAETYASSHLQADKKNLHQSASKIREQLLRKAKDMLSGLADVAVTGKGQLETVQVLRELEAVKTDVLMFAAACKNLPEGKSLDFKDFAGVEIENKDSARLSKEEKDEMRLVFRANRTAGYPEKLYKKTVEDFEETIKEAGHTFRTLKHEGEIVAFFHYDQIAPDRIYVGSLNLHPSAKDSPIAVSMIKSSLEENTDKDIEAVVWAGNSARVFYTRMLGFKKVGEIADYHGTGETYWQLERPKQKPEVLKAAA